MKPEVVLITGCSTGIGRTTAVTLAATGYTVIATARKPDALERYGRIDVLVNNAGCALRGAVEELEIAAVQRMFDVNVHGIIRLVGAVAPSMRARGSGRIVNISSVAGRIAAPANGAYAATLDQRHFRAVRPTHLDALELREPS
jgi:NADP-dependent 3-hydroxy acid dehydrogenase YdfG